MFVISFLVNDFFICAHKEVTADEALESSFLSDNFYPVHAWKRGDWAGVI